MNNIKKFIDKISYLEGRSAKDLVMPLSDARQVRDELIKLLLDVKTVEDKDQVIEVVVKGGKW